ncbi:FxsA family protein [Verrucomicrobiales bacterium BCK34]|nr:FxsA family protein [Verrucomicrobiales bacterium BCK34]
MFARLLLLFIGIPVIELFLFMVLGSKIGIPLTLLIIILTGALGAHLTRSQGLQALNNYKAATAQGKLPHEEVLDGLMILIAGAVLLTPGFLTDAIGFSLLVPSIRGSVRKVLGAYLKGKITVVGQNMGAPDRSRPSQATINIDAEVIDITPTSSSSSKEQSP